MNHTPYAIHAGLLIDGYSDTPRHDMMLIIENGRIQQLERAVELPLPNALPVLDARRQVVMPGLIDAHVHITYSGDPTEPWAAQDLQDSIGMLAIKGGAFAAATLRAGFTTVRDLGARSYTNIAVRDAIEQGLIVGCRIVACGLPLCSTGGHFDHSISYRTVDVPGRAEIVDSPDEARRAVRRQFKKGADLIKIAVDGRVGSSFDPRSTEWQEFSRAELEAICNTAHEAGRPVAAHTAGGPGLADAIEAGIDSLEHLQGFSDATLDLLAAKGIFLVPTLMATRCTIDYGTAPQAPRHLQQAALAWMQRNWEEKVEAMARALKAGVKIVLGTDAGYAHCLHGNNAYELQLLVETGMSPMKAIQAATSLAAKCLCWGDALGRLAPGYLGDILILDQNPLEDISILQRGKAISRVIKSGIVVHTRIVHDHNLGPWAGRSVNHDKLG